MTTKTEKTAEDKAEAPAPAEGSYTAAEKTPFLTPELRKKMAMTEAAGWMPEPGDVLTGTVEHIGTRKSDFGLYPVLTMSRPGAEAGSTEYVAVHAFHGTLKGALYDLKPTVGDKISITYVGTRTGKKLDDFGDPVEYHLYTAEGKETVFDWKTGVPF